MVVYTRRREAVRSAKGSMIQHSGCVAEILKFLPPVDLARFALCSSTLHQMVFKNNSNRNSNNTSVDGKDDDDGDGDGEISLEFRLRWRRTLSRSWWSWFDRLEEQEYADDHPFKKLRLGGLEDDFKAFAKTENEMLENIAAWCGGWKTFLHNRQQGATRPVVPRSLQLPTSSSTAYLRAGDNNGIHNLCKPVVLFDLYCNGEWKWGAVHPLCNDDLRTLPGMVGRRDIHNYGVFYPYSTRSLGDKIGNRTIHGWNHGRRPDRYLLSTDSTDNSTWRFCVSVVSPNFAETLVESADIVPVETLNDGSLNWNRQLAVPSASVAVRQGNRENFSVFDMLAGDNNELPRTPHIRFWFFEDNQPQRFHMCADIWIPTTSFYDMLVHPPPAPLLSATKRSKKRRR